MKPEFLRPFDAAAACRGAPFCCTNGWRAEVLKYATNGLFGTITKPSGEEFPASWTIAGESDSGVISKDKDLAMLPLGRIENKPVFVGDRLLDAKGAEFTVTVGQVFGPGCLCKWAPPAKVYPETRMTDAEIQRATPKLGMRPSDDVMALSEIAGSLRALVNAALRHAVDAGQLVPVSEAKPSLRPHCPYTGKLRDPHDIETDPMGVLVRHSGEPLRGIEGRAARDMVVAKAIRDVCMAKVNKFHNRAAQELLSVDLLSIINTAQ